MTPVPFRDRVGTPGTPDGVRMLLLGSGELGREVAIEAMRLGAEVVAVDRYAGAPAMQVAHRSRALKMTDPKALRALVEREHPDVIVPEIEQIATEELVRLEKAGWNVAPSATATRTTMDRERIRRLAVDAARVATSRFDYAESLGASRRVAAEIGYPCVFKALMSSSGHGMTVVHGPSEVEAAYRSAAEHGRVANPRVMVEEFLTFDLEVTVLALRHYDPSGQLTTTVLPPIAHHRPGTLYHESWQPSGLSASTVLRLSEVAVAVTAALGGVGVFGVECFVAGDRVLFSEVSPRPHDTGLVTLASQWNSEFALHARAILGLPYVGPEPVAPSAAHVILAEKKGSAPVYGGLSTALAERAVRLFLFSKPDAYPDRRLGVAVARGDTIEDARRRAEKAAHAVQRAVQYGRPAERALRRVGRVRGRRGVTTRR